MQYRSNVTRREFLRAIAGAGAALTLPGCTFQNKFFNKAIPQPNLLIVCLDQWRRMAMSYYDQPRFKGTVNQGDPVLTPNFDRVAAEGMIFHNATACTPICSPNRATLMTGLYPNTHTLTSNTQYERFSYDNETFAHVLARHGYETAHLGKWHMSKLEDWKDYPRFHETPGEKRGFAYWYGAPLHNHTHFDAQHFHAETEIDGQENFVAGGDPLPNPFIPAVHYKDRTRRIEESWDPNHLTRKALDYLKNTYQVRDAQKPFVLHLSYDPPHTIHGYMPDSDTIGSCQIAGIKKGPDGQNLGYDSPSHYYQYRAPVEFEARYRTEKTFDAPVKAGLPQRPNVTASGLGAHSYSCLPGYYGAVDSLDELFGRIDAFLAATPDPRTPGKTYKETTIVAITADHGDMMGSHGQLTKGPFMEESVSVPFIIRWPGRIRAGAEETMPFNSVDVAPTLLGLLGAQFSRKVDGVDRSAVMVNDDPQRVARARATYSFLRSQEYPGGGWRAVRSRDFLFAIQYFEKNNKPICALYDLVKDPFQMRAIGLGKGHDELIAELNSALQQHLRDIHDPDAELYQMPEVRAGKKV